MKAVIQARARDNRPFLPDLIPLETPTVVFIDPTDKCNLKCGFCPTGDHELMRKTPGRNHGHMHLDLFKRVVDGCEGFRSKIKVGRLYKDGEPLSNAYFAEMVKYAKDSGRFETIDTTTNAVLLTPQKSDALLNAGLDRINISIYAMDKSRYEQFTGRPVNVSALIDNIGYFYENSRGRCVMNIKINADIVSEEQVRQFYATFGDLCDEISPPEHVMECWGGFDFASKGLGANQLVGIYGQGIGSRIVCPYVFYSIAVNSNGEVSVCFLDWAHKMVVGNASTSSLPEIWNGKNMNEHRLMMLEGRRGEHPVCSSCGQMSHGTMDNLDGHRADLLVRIQS